MVFHLLRGVVVLVLFPSTTLLMVFLFAALPPLVYRPRFVPCPPLLPDEVPGLPEEGPGFWFVFCGCVLVFFLSGPASQTPAVVAISPILLVQSSTTDRSSGVANGARGSNLSLISNKSNKSDFGRVTSSIVSAVLRSNGRCFFSKFKLSQSKPSAGMVGFPKLFYILTVK